MELFSSSSAESMVEVFRLESFGNSLSLILHDCCLYGPYL